MRISDRLMAIYDAVSPGETVADIGTDHGYVPLMLYRDGISPSVIMSDISGDSLSKAIESFTSHNIDLGDDHFRTGDGLTVIGPAETDVVIIAGLGGKTIVDILAADEAKSESFGKYVIQPRNSSGNVRFWLYKHGYAVTGETLAREGKFICEVLTAERSVLPDIGYDADDIRWTYPETFRECDRELLGERIGWKLSSIDEEIGNLKRSTADQTERINKLMADREYLLTLLDE